MLDQGIFSAGWQYFARPIVDSQKRATITITQYPPGAQHWDFQNGVAKTAGTLIYTGSAGVDRVMRPRRREFVEDEADTQMLRVTIPIPAAKLALASNQEVVITACPDNPQYVGMKAYIESYAGGSNDWEITLQCITNAKQA